MSKKPTIPDLNFTMHSGSYDAQGMDGEFVNSANMSLFDRQEKQAKVWKFAESTAAEHGAAHDILVNAANVNPMPEGASLMMNAFEYQGTMQPEFLVLGIQRTMQSMNEMRPPFGNANVSKDEIATAIREKTEIAYHYSHNRARGTAGNKAAFVLGREHNIPQFQVHQDYNFVDVDMDSAAKHQGLEKELAQVRDGDTYYFQGEAQVYKDLVSPDFASEFYQTVIERAATYIHERKDQILKPQGLQSFLENETFGEQYEIMLKSDTADLEDRNTAWESTIGFQGKEPQITNENTLTQG